MTDNRSFDHMLGGLKSADPGIDTWPNGYTNPDTQGKEIPQQTVLAVDEQKLNSAKRIAAMRVGDSD